MATRKNWQSSANNYSYDTEHDNSCFICGKHIHEICPILRNGRKVHVNCFVCASCHLPLTTRDNYKCRGTRVYCEFHGPGLKTREQRTRQRTFTSIAGTGTSRSNEFEAGGTEDTDRSPRPRSTSFDDNIPCELCGMLVESAAYEEHLYLCFGDYDSDADSGDVAEIQTDERSVTGGNFEAENETYAEDTHTHRDEDQQLKCKICTINDLSVVYLCGHTYCADCPKELERCAYCARPLEDPRKFYL